MIEENVLILENKKIAKDVYRMVLKSDNTDKLLPGQFINIKVKDNFLRRPISLCSIEPGKLSIIYKIQGIGTDKLSSYRVNEMLNIHLQLGNGFNVNKNLDEVLLIGGGVGVPPLYELAKRYRKIGTRVIGVLGYRSSEDVFLESEFKDLGVETYVATDDGSYGFHGNVIELIESENIKTDFVYSVGPKPLLKAVSDIYSKGFISLEERMGCGIGACMGCVCHGGKDPSKYYRVCKEGPVFEIGKVEI